MLKVPSKSLNFTISPRIRHTIHILAQAVGALAQVVGDQAPTTEYETTPLVGETVEKWAIIRKSTLKNREK